jgi:hypothetical protein
MLMYFAVKPVWEYINAQAEGSSLPDPGKASNRKELR